MWQPRQTPSTNEAPIWPNAQEQLLDGPRGEKVSSLRLGLLSPAVGFHVNYTRRKNIMSCRATLNLQQTQSSSQKKELPAFMEAEVINGSVCPTSIHNCEHTKSFVHMCLLHTNCGGLDTLHNSWVVCRRQPSFVEIFLSSSLVSLTPLSHRATFHSLHLLRGSSWLLSMLCKRCIFPTEPHLTLRRCNPLFHLLQ